MAFGYDDERYEQICLPAGHAADHRQVSRQRRGPDKHEGRVCSASCWSGNILGSPNGLWPVHAAGAFMTSIAPRTVLSQSAARGRLGELGLTRAMRATREAEASYFWRARFCLFGT